MKRIKFTVCFLSVFLFYNVESVSAQELSCIYEGDAGSDVDDQAIMIVQDFDGNHTIYRHEKKNTPEIDDPDWKKINADKKYEWDTIQYNEDTGLLSSCPMYAYLKKPETTNTYTLYLRDKTDTWQDDKEFYKQYDYVPDSANIDDNQDTITDEEIANTDWWGICSYSTVTLYYNSEKFALVGKIITSTGTRANFSLNDLTEFYNLNCPARIYRSDVRTSNGNTNMYAKEYSLNNANGGVEETLVPSESKFNNTEYEDEEPTEIDDCNGLFSKEFIKELNSYLVYIRIFVPILLIAMGVLDFTKAIFSFSEEEMKKAQGRFMKRVVAAVLVFLVPTLVNLLLNIANSVWGYIDPNSCNIG